MIEKIKNWLGLKPKVWRNDEGYLVWFDEGNNRVDYYCPCGRLE